MLLVNQLSGFGSEVTPPPPLPLSLSYVSSILSSETSGRTFNSESSTDLGPILPLDNKRYVLVLIHSSWGSGGGDGWTNSCTIGGISATKLFRANFFGTQVTDCWYIDNNTLTSGNLRVTWNGTGSQDVKTTFGVYNLINPSSITPTVTTNAVFATSVSVSVTRTTAQVGLAMASPYTASGSAISWTNATVNYNLLGNSTTYFSGALITGSGTFNVTATKGASGAMTTTAAIWS